MWILFVHTTAKRARRDMKKGPGARVTPVFMQSRLLCPHGVIGSQSRPPILNSSQPWSWRCHSWLWWGLVMTSGRNASNKVSSIWKCCTVTFFREIRRSWSEKCSEIWWFEMNDPPDSLKYCNSHIVSCEQMLNWAELSGAVVVNFQTEWVNPLSTISLNSDESLVHLIRTPSCSATVHNAFM